MVVFRPVVAGLDGSRESLAAASWAAGEALRRGLPLRLVHACEGLPEDGTDTALPELRAPRERAHRVLRAAGDRLDERYPQLPITTELLRQSPGPALLAETESAELLVIGSQGLGAVGGFLSGSVAMATVAHAEGPVVLVRAGGPVPDADGDVVVALDIGSPCDAVLEFAFRAAELRRAPLRAVHVRHVAYGHAVPGGRERERVGASAERELSALLEPWRQKYAGVRVREKLSEGRPAQVLVEAARGAGLLVAGRRRRRTAIGSHTGPVAHALIRHAHCPVAVVPHD